MPYQQSKVKSAPNHTSMGIIDRAIRTIRDAAFNSGIGVITPTIMTRLIDLINRAPHKTLSKIMQFDVSPYVAEHDYSLEIEIIKRIRAQNDVIKQRAGFKLERGATAEVYNSVDPLMKRRSRVKPLPRTVESVNGAIYTLRGPNGTVEKESRYQLKPVKSS
jgi:hypothetical protein